MDKKQDQQRGSQGQPSQQQKEKRQGNQPGSGSKPDLERDERERDER